MKVSKHTESGTLGSRLATESVLNSFITLKKYVNKCIFKRQDSINKPREIISAKYC